MTGPGGQLIIGPGFRSRRGTQGGEGAAARQARSVLWTASVKISVGGVQGRRERHPNQLGLCYAQLLSKVHWKGFKGNCSPSENTYFLISFK